MMSTAGQTENQQRVVKLFCDTIGYDYLGNWIDQGGNYNIDAGLLNAFLKSQGVDAALISHAMHEAWNNEDENGKQN